MNEITIPALVPAATSGNLTNLIAERAWFEPNRVMMSRPLGDGWQKVSAQELDAEVRATAKGLIAAGIQIGDRVAIMARTRYEWTILDFAIWFAGGCVVPIYETSSAEQVDWILSDSGAVGLIVETPTHRELVNSVLPSHTKHIWTMTEDVLSVLAKAGAHIGDDEIDRRRNALLPDTLATLIYTSGTTGKPKGVALTHGNFLSECGNVVEGASDLFLKPNGSTLLFLPVAHVFGRMVQIGAIRAGLHLAHCSDPVGRLQPDLASFKPTFVLAVPRIFEKVYNGAEAKADAAGKGKIFRKAAEVAVAYSESLDKRGFNPLLTLQHALFNKLVYSKIRAALGGNVEAAISGGALTAGSTGFQLTSQENVSSNYVFCRMKNQEYNYSSNPTFVSGSGNLLYSSMVYNPQTFVTTVGLYNTNSELLAVAKLSRPLVKDFTKEALIRVKLDW
jgi:long-chain acyl-CoA synthetase